MAKRLSEEEKKGIYELYINGKNIEEISKLIGCTKLTISRNLKKYIGEENYKQITNKNKFSLKDDSKKESKLSFEIQSKINETKMMKILIKYNLLK